MMTSVEAVVPEAEPKSHEELFHELWERMPESMRQYQSLVERRNDLFSSVKSHEGDLADIDLEASATSQPEEVAQAALGLYVLQRKLSLVEKQIYDLDREGSGLFRLKGREVEVEPLGDYTITKGRYTYKQVYNATRGFISKTSLRPSQGGSIEFTGRRKGGAKFSADPLFDPFSEEHAPNFRVTLI